MRLNAFLAVVALVGTGLMLMRGAQRPIALGAVVVSAALVLLSFGIISIHISAAILIGWVAVAVLSSLIFLRQSGRTGSGLCAMVITAAAIPILSWLGLIH